MSTINERIGEVITSLGLTKTAFAERLNVSQQYVSKLIRTGNPSERLLVSICREFNVNDRWLRTGEGEMFLQRSTEDEIAAFMGDVLKDEPDNFRREFLAALARMDDAGWEALGKFLNDFNDKKREAQD